MKLNSTPRLSEHRAAVLTRRFITLLELSFISHPSSAQSDHPWAGPYMGLNAGGAHSASCATVSLQGATVGSENVPGFSNQYCPNGDFVGGVQLGENFQIKRFVWGIGADLDAWSAKSVQGSRKYTGSLLPPGEYSFFGKLNPDAFAIIGGRIGYAGDLMLPYLRLGGIFTTGSHNSTLVYTPTATTKPSASFNGGQNFTSSGWVAGGGTEIGLNGAWSITAEYLHVSLGKSSNATALCNGTPADCAAFVGTSLDSSHGTFAANMFRISINYWFRYWEP